MEFIGYSSNQSVNLSTLSIEIARTRANLQRELFEKIEQTITFAIFESNPESNTGVPITGVYRTPSPGSQPETYVRPSTNHSDIAQNYYFNRDARRNYPRLAVYTQNDVAKLITASHLKSITAGNQDASKESTTTETKEPTTTEMVIPEKLELTEAIASSPVLYSADKLPPVPPTFHTYRWKKSEDADDPNPGVYWPMKMVS
ncbi:13331_t:CDS:2 [Dentiscutata erythropus]|uniref:13331_t:CDS:1 n=1 Tax=Dentiscutata erythropus TaxID=1348616 RepID=A0A9N8YNE8_9GLOM|nr:13331_t:CDS:2 [Dentiscutata erythropus]